MTMNQINNAANRNGINVLIVTMLKGKTKHFQKGNEQQCYLVELNRRTYETAMNIKVSLLE